MESNVNASDCFMMISNFISIGIYYLFQIFTYNKQKDKEKTSADIIVKYVVLPFALLVVGFFPLWVAILYICYVIIVGSLNLLRGRKFFDNIETFDLIKKDNSNLIRKNDSY